MNNKLESIIDYVINSMPNEYFTAVLLHKMYSHCYCIINDKGKDKWFKLTEDGFWYPSTSIRHELKIKMSNEVAQVIYDARTYFRNQILKGYNNSGNIQWEESRMKLLLEWEKKLYSSTYKDLVLKECETIFFVEDLPNISIAPKAEES